MSDLWRASVINTLHSLGAHSVDLLRAQKDGNGQPCGDPAVIGSLYGCRYGTRRGMTLSLDIQGAVDSNAGAPLFAGVMKRGNGPEPGDIIRHGAQTAEIIGVHKYMGDLCILTLDKDVTL